MIHSTSLRRFAIALSFSALSGTAAQAQSASVVFDWSHFTIEVIDTNPADGVDASVKVDSSYSGADGCLSAPLGMPCSDPGISDADWTTASFANYAFGAMVGSAGYDSAQVHASASGASPSGPRLVGAFRGALLTTAGDAEVKVRLPYTLSVDAAGSDAMHASFAYASLWVGSSGFQRDYISTLWDGTFTQSGTFELGWSQTGSGSIDLGAFAYARLDEAPIRAPVPEPTTWAMLLGGAALIAARRGAARAGR